MGVRQPALGVLGEDRRMKRLLISLVVGVLVLAGCSDETPTPPESQSSPSASSSASSSATPPGPPPRPRDRACYRIDHAAALEPTAAADEVSCSARHTSMTFTVGDLGPSLDLAQACTKRFAAFVGGTPQSRQLSMLRPVWFTPTEEEAGAGADWFRCDVVALAGADRLAPLTGRLAGVLGRERQRATYAMCGTAAPGAPGFERVICSRPHSWRAVSTVPFTAKRYPGVARVRSAGDEPCRAAGDAAAGGALDYEWGYEWPTARQWTGGQRYGICWVPA